MIQVIFTTGKFGEIRDVHLGKFLGHGVIAAYKPFDEWIELRRRRRSVYDGQERRTHGR
ncbi:MAG TPA: hypothetical protein VJ550_03575 [Geomonas sp.]|nr:hypothetical protein [Geomonas sp.]